MAEDALDGLLRLDDELLVATELSEDVELGLAGELALLGLD